MSDLSPAQSLLQDLLLSKNSIAAAKTAWSATSTEVVSGLTDRDGRRPTFSNYVELKDRYLSIARYCVDANRLISFHAGREDASFNELMAIDPHLMRAYAESWDPNSHTGFFFLNSEAPTSWDNEAQRFPIFTYTTNFSTVSPIILDAGRSEVSGQLAYFTKVAAGEEVAAKRADEPMDIGQFLGELESSFLIDKSSEEDLQSAFERLVLAGGAPQMKQQLALSRLIGLMKREAFLPPEMAIRNECTGGEYSSELDFFSARMRFLRNNPAFLNPVRQQITSAYQEFKKTEEYIPQCAELRGFQKWEGELRGGELDDLNALIEVHILNSCLRLCGLPVQVNYVTLSLRMFNFVRQFNDNEFRVPLLHPRSAMMLHSSQLFDQHKDEMTRVVTNAIAFASAIPKNKTITHGEIDRFDNDFGDALKSTRNTFLHSAADTPDERERMIHAIDRIVGKSEENHKNKWREIRVELSSQLSSQVESVGTLFSEESSSLANSAWYAYRDFATNKERNENINVFIRIFRDHNGNGARLVVMPLEGPYRYAFIVHNAETVKLFERENDDQFKKISIGEFLSVIDGKEPLNGTDDIVDCKRDAIRFFARAIFSASHSQWPLAESLSTQAIEMLEGFDLKTAGDNSENDAIKVRAQLMLQELYFLRHLCRRAVAQSSDPYRGKSSWLKRASKDLRESSRLTIVVPKEYAPYETATNPVSLRQALAAVGLEIEWLVNTSHRKLPKQPLEVLEPTQNPEIAWADEDFVEGRAAYPGSALFEFAKTIRDKINHIRTSLLEGETSKHKEEDWRYLLLRSEVMILLIRACVDADLLPAEFINGDKDSDTSEEILKIAQEFDRHRDWIEVRRSGDEYFDVERSPNPFLSALISAANIRQRVSYDVNSQRWLVDNPSELLAAFAKMDGNCNSLDPRGFPRAVIRAIKKKYAPALCAHIRSQYSEEFDADAELFDAVPQAEDFGLRAVHAQED